MKKSPFFIGFLQAVGVSAYCFIIVGFFFLMDKYMPTSSEPMFIGAGIMLIIFVLSAAITGSMVFGYPVYLILKENKIKEGLQILGFFTLFLLGIIIIYLVLGSILIPEYGMDPIIN